MKRQLLTMITALLLTVMLGLAPAPASALDADEMFTDTAQETRARDLGRQLRCLKCRNQSIFDSNAGIAKDLRVVVRERMVEGDSDEEILAYVADRFGDYVLLKPRVATHTYVLWLAPFAFMLLGAAAMWGYLRGRRVQPVKVGLTDDEQQEAQRILDGGTS